MLSILLTTAGCNRQHQSLNAFELCQDYKKGRLKGKLKEVAATLGEDDNRVVMLVKHRKKGL